VHRATLPYPQEFLRQRGLSLSRHGHSVMYEHGTIRCSYWPLRSTPRSSAWSSAGSTCTLLKRDAGRIGRSGRSRRMPADLVQFFRGNSEVSGLSNSRTVALAGPKILVALARIQSHTLRVTVRYAAFIGDENAVCAPALSKERSGYAAIPFQDHSRFPRPAFQ
jgi:hypothetical protein